MAVIMSWTDDMLNKVEVSKCGVEVRNVWMTGDIKVDVEVTNDHEWNGVRGKAFYQVSEFFNEQ